MQGSLSLKDSRDIDDCFVERVEFVIWRESVVVEHVLVENLLDL
jgi:hypothetical protein